MFKYLNSKIHCCFWMGFFLMCWALPFALQAQYRLKLINETTDSIVVNKLFSSERNFSDSLAVAAFLSQELKTLHTNAYLEASVDSIYYHDSIASAHLHLGPLYNWLSLRTTNIPRHIYSKL